MTTIRCTGLKARRRCAAAALLALSLSGCSVIRNDFGSETVFGRTTSGLYDATDTYVVNLLLCEARLAPEQVTAVPGTTGNFFDVLSAQFPTGAGWSYVSARRRLSRGTILVRTYDVQGSPTRVGAELHVKYQPRRADPSTNIHWIQVITNNHDLKTNPGHGNPGNSVDIPAAATTPYYDDGYAADSGTCSPSCDFYDFPGRVDTARDHTWQAVTFIVQGPAVGAGPGRITFLRPGFRWGWENSCTPILGYLGYILFNEAPVVFTASAAIEPGAAVELAARPAELVLAKGESRTAVRLEEARFAIAIEKQAEADRGEGGHTRFTVRQGTGRLGSLRVEGRDVGAAAFTIEGGQGFIHWETGEASIETSIRLAAEGLGELRLLATGTAQVDFRSRTFTLQPGWQAVEPDKRPQTAEARRDDAAP